MIKRKNEKVKKNNFVYENKSEESDFSDYSDSDTESESSVEEMEVPQIEEKKYKDPIFRGRPYTPEDPYIPDDRKRTYWAITFFDLENWETTKLKLQEYCRYATGQEEICPHTQRPHQQVYLETKNPRDFKYVKKNLSETGHIEPPWLSSDACRTYCQKEETRKPGTTFWEIGKWTGKVQKGKRNDLIKLSKDIQEQKITRSEIILTMPVVAQCNHWVIDETFKELEKKFKRDITQIKYKALFGSARSGKSTWALSQAPNAFIKTENGQWPWEGYNGQTEIIFEEFGVAGINFTDFKNLKCVPHFRMPIKNSTIVCKATTFYFISNDPVTKWYPNAISTEAHLESFYDRFDEIYEYTGNYKKGTAQVKQITNIEELFAPRLKEINSNGKYPQDLLGKANRA